MDGIKVGAMDGNVDGVELGARVGIILGECDGWEDFNSLGKDEGTFDIVGD